MWLERYGISLRRVFPGVPFTRARLQERREHDARNDGQDEKQPFRKGINPEDAEANHEDLLDRFNRAKVNHPVSKASKLLYPLCQCCYVRRTSIFTFHLKLDSSEAFILLLSVFEDLVLDTADPAIPSGYRHG